MSAEHVFPNSNPLFYPPAEFGQRFWKIGIDGLELIHTIQVLDPLTEELLRSLIERYELLRPLLQHDLDWWVADDAPHFEPTASSHFEAIFRRFERIGRYAFYAGERFTPSTSAFPLPHEWNLDYELASAFVHHRIERIDLATTATGLRKEVIRNMTRPMCRLSWERACVGEWRFQMYMEMLEATPEYHWQLDRTPLIRAIREPQPVKERPRLMADPDTRTVYLDGREIASQIGPDTFAYVSAVIAAHPHPTPFRDIEATPGMKGKNQTRIRAKLEQQSRALFRLIEADSKGHYLKLPARE